MINYYLKSRDSLSFTVFLCFFKHCLFFDTNVHKSAFWKKKSHSHETSFLKNWNFGLFFFENMILNLDMLTHYWSFLTSRNILEDSSFFSTLILLYWSSFSPMFMKPRPQDLHWFVKWLTGRTSKHKRAFRTGSQFSQRVSPSLCALLLRSQLHPLFLIWPYLDESGIKKIDDWTHQCFFFF